MKKTELYKPYRMNYTKKNNTRVCKSLNILRFVAMVVETCCVDNVINSKTGSSQEWWTEHPQQYFILFVHLNTVQRIFSATAQGLQLLYLALQARRVSVTEFLSA